MEEEIVIEVIRQIGYNFCELYYKVGTILDVKEYDEEYYKVLYTGRRNTFIDKTFTRILPNKLEWKKIE